MDRSRAEFFSTIAAMMSLTGDALLVDALPVNALHNNRARFGVGLLFLHSLI